MYLPETVQQNCRIFDGDKLTLQKRLELKPTIPSLKEARRIANEWILAHFNFLVKEALSKKEDFVYEGHLPEDELWSTPRKFKRYGYKIHLIFFGLTDTDLCAVRVLERAKLGGHDVPPYEIERNYDGNLWQLNKRFKSIDNLQIVDTSESHKHTVLAVFTKGKLDFALHHGRLPEWFEKKLPALYRIIEKRDLSSIIFKGED